MVSFLLHSVAGFRKILSLFNKLFCKANSNACVVILTYSQARFEPECSQRAITAPCALWNSA